MARRKKTMREIRSRAIELALTGRSRINTKLWSNTQRNYNLYYMQELMHYCMKKEYKEGEHQGAMNPYC